MVGIAELLPCVSHCRSLPFVIEVLAWNPTRRSICVSTGPLFCCFLQLLSQKRVVRKLCASSVKSCHLSNMLACEEALALAHRLCAIFAPISACFRVNWF